MIGTSHSMRASGEGMYTEGDHSLIGQTRAAITGNNDGEFEEIDNESTEERGSSEEEEGNEDDAGETPLYRQSNTKHLAWYQRIFENTLTRFMGIRV